MKRLRLVFLVLPLLLGCASAIVDESDRLARAGDYEAAYATLDAAIQRRPDDPAVRTAHARARDRLVVRALAMTELALAGGRSDEAQRLVERVRRLDGSHPRLAALEADIEAARRRQRDVEARRAEPAATAPAADAAPTLGPAFQKPVSLELRDAPLRQVFEALARTSGVNFVFDKDVRSDTRVTVFLRQLSLDEALRVVLSTQQLDRKLLNASTVLIYPNTPPKQREHQELVTRTFYVVNADVKQAAALVKMMAKTRDVYPDERLNALVVRDTPEVVRLVEKLLATIDLPEPEVMLAVEVLEVASEQVDVLGLNWPTQIEFGVPGGGTPLPVSRLNELRGLVANPALTAALRGRQGSTNLLANPTIRARNREKAKVQIGEKLPVFSTTSATANVGASTTVTTLDVGLKLDVEPTVQLDGEVTIKVSLEVSSLVGEVAGPAGSLAYRVGTRLTTTSLRLKDGQTQVLSGLINDEDRRSATGLPGLAGAPVIGRLFGVNDNERTKTEIVMLITPRIVRNLQVVSRADATLPSGTDQLPGQAPLRLREPARAGVAPGAGSGSTAGPATTAEPTLVAAPAPDAAVLTLALTPEAAVGDTVSVALSNRSGLNVRGELQFDTSRLQATSGVTASGRAGFALGAREEAVVVLRVLAPAAGSSVAVSVVGVAASTPTGEAADIRLEGSDAVVQVRAAPAAGAAR